MSYKFNPFTGNFDDVGSASGGGITELTGDVTAGPGSGSQAATIANDSVSNGKLANMATQTIKGRTTAGTGDPEDLTASQATAILNNMVGDSGAGGTKGLVPAPAAGDAAANKFLKADGTWVTFGDTTNSAISAWTAYTPTFTGFGTVSTQNTRWRRVGQSLEVICTFIPGTPTATEARVSLPSGLTSASTIDTIEAAGKAYINVTSNGDSSVLIEPSVTYFTFGRDTVSNSTLQKFNGSTWVAAGNKVSFFASIPISGWTADGVSVVTDFAVTSVKTANYTANYGELVLVDPSGGAFTVTLPTASGNSGKRIVVKVDSATTTWHLAATVDGNASETIDGATTFPLYTPGEELEIVSDGTNWRINNHFCNTTWQSETPGYSTVGTYDGAITAVTKATTGITTDVRKYKRNGNCLDIIQTYVATNTTGGSETAGILISLLPKSLSTDTSIVNRINSTFFNTGAANYTGNCTELGTGLIMNSGTLNSADHRVLPYNSTYICLFLPRNTAFWSTTQVGLRNAAGTVSVVIRASIPINGWQG